MSIRKALLVGINAYTDAPLRGCINDIYQMQGLLQRYYGFAAADIRLLLDDAATGAAIQAGLEWLAEGGDDADAVRVFHYSGHGSYVADRDGDEPDGRDECLAPYDYKANGMLTDDVLKSYYDRFPPAGNLTLVMDCCHSGTINRLVGDTAARFLPVSRDEQARVDAAAARYLEQQNRFILEGLAEWVNQLFGDALFAKQQELAAQFRARRAGHVLTQENNILLAGCQSVQTSADAFIKKGYHGAFTYYLAEAVAEANGQLTYRALADRTAAKLGAEGFDQVPQLEFAGQRDQALLFRPFVT
jgi:hypothetical protein